MSATSMASGRVDEQYETWARRRLGQRLLILSSLALVVLAAVAALILVQGTTRQVNDVLHTYNVRNEARELTLALSRVESSQLGYLLTRDESYLEPFQQAASSLDSQLLSLTAITQDDPAQAERVRSIASEVVQRAAEMARTIDLLDENRSAEAMSLIQTGMRENAMERVRATLELFISEETEKLLDRNDRIEMSRRWLVGAILAALTGAVLLSYTLLSGTQRTVSALARSQDLLLSENQILEAHVQERTQALDEAREHAERERHRVETLLQDANHRIGNSLATVSSLLGLQLMRSKSLDVRSALESARSRVHSIASAHRRLRLGSDNETASADEFLGAVLEDIGVTADGTKRVELVGHFDPIVVNARDATTLGILVGELVTNAVKHAFPDGRAGTITVRLERDADGVPTLWVSDDGVGMDTQLHAGDGGLGSVIVHQLATQFGGEPKYEKSSSGGLSVSVSLPGIEGAPPSTES
jgi:two-component sensor histidine kinase/CHASE3 domain sensor protein